MDREARGHVGQARTAELAPFLDGIAARTVAPAGGSAIAVVGAIGASLAGMAAVHTLASDHESAAGLATIRDRLAADRSTLVALAEADARAVDAAFGGEADPLDRAEREQLAAVPLAIAEACRNAISRARDLRTRVKQSVKRDLQTAITLLTGAIRAAVEMADQNSDLPSGRAAERLRERVAAVAASSAIEW
ncbi:MAG: cyclodeaminase/cyclohydrolase family protein [Halodesulfurarchaeum sp.]